MVPDLLDRRKVSDSGLNRRGDAQGDVTERFLIVLVPGVELISGTGSTEDCYDSITMIFFTDNCFMSTLADTLCSMDVSRSPDSLTSYPCFPYHMPLARVLVRSHSRLTCFLLLDTRTYTDTRLVTGYLFDSRFPFLCW